MTQIYDQYLAPSGLTLTQYSLLANLVRRVPPSVHELAEVMGMDRTTVTRNLKPLLARGLLGLVPGCDRRSKLVAVTEDGQRTWGEARVLWRVAQSEINRRLGDIETAELHRMLDQSFDKLAAD
jgi:DNA-binding MarR family transcriptional regulator